jgi:hypothetical protein
MDLQLAAYAAGKEAYNTSRPTPINQLFPRKRFEQHKTREAHNRQVQMYLDRERFQQNATWRSEYDRLQAADFKTPTMQKRLENLASAMQVDLPDAKSALFSKA